MVPESDMDLDLSFVQSEFPHKVGSLVVIEDNHDMISGSVQYLHNLVRSNPNGQWFH